MSFSRFLSLAAGFARPQRTTSSRAGAQARRWGMGGSLLLSSLLGAAPARAQKQFVQERQAWLGVFNQTRFSDRWGLWAERHLRLHDQFVGELFQAVGRVGATY